LLHILGHQLVEYWYNPIATKNRQDLIISFQTF
jgi:hypothetical protein